MYIFFGNLTSDNEAILGAEESRHAIKVLRKQPGDEIYFTEGKGTLYKGTIDSQSKTETHISILASFPSYGEHAFHIRMAVSPLRLKDRFEWMIEKAVELGVNEIVPLQCKRTDPFKAKYKDERIKTLMMAALKQCKRTQFPELHPLTPINDWLKQDIKGAKFIGWCEEDTQAIQDFSTNIQQENELTFLIGPEGDFTDEEVEMARQADFIPISLGENRLRTETAAIFGLSIFKLIKGY
ncbi:MAG: RsmE family RNA methyltransferase [Bacteroidota bacterium]